MHADLSLRETLSWPNKQRGLSARAGVKEALPGRASGMGRILRGSRPAEFLVAHYFSTHTGFGRPGSAG